MMTAKTLLFLALGATTVLYAYAWMSAVRRSMATRITQADRPSVGIVETAIGFVTNFFDTLGIGAFAPTTALYRLRKLVPDEKIPGTMNVGHAIPVVVQAFIYIAIVDVGTTTLVALIASSVLGMWLGAGVVATWPRRNIQIGMGIAMLVAAVLTITTILNASAGGGEATSLEGWRLGVGVGGNFVLGALMSLGIGLYGPCLIMISLLGMNPKAAFPIMMGSCAFLMPVGSLQFIKNESYNLRASIGLTLGGIPAVLIAAYIIREMDLLYVRWLVVVVVVYTAIMLLRSAWAEPYSANSARPK